MNVGQGSGRAVQAGETSKRDMKSLIANLESKNREIKLTLEAIHADVAGAFPTSGSKEPEPHITCTLDALEYINAMASQNLIQAYQLRSALGA